MQRTQRVEGEANKQSADPSASIDLTRRSPSLRRFQYCMDDIVLDMTRGY